VGYIVTDTGIMGYIVTDTGVIGVILLQIEE
jgi:hypothetical protein